MIINFNPRNGAEYYGIDQIFRFRYGVYTAPAYGFPEVQQDFIDLNVKIDTIIAKLPEDFIAGSTDATSLESNHGTGAWKTGSIGGGGGGGGGGYVSKPDIWQSKEKLKLIEDVKDLLSMMTNLSKLKASKDQLTKADLASLVKSLSKQINDNAILLVNLKKIIQAKATILPQEIRKEFIDKIDSIEQKWGEKLEQEQLGIESGMTELKVEIEELAKLVIKLLSDKDLEALINEFG